MQEETVASGTSTRPSKLVQLKNGFVKVFKTLSSPVGLLILLVGYSFAGAYIFKAIEGPFEVQEKYDIIDIRKEIIDRMWNKTRLVTTRRLEFTNTFEQELRKYEASLHTAFAHGINSDSEEVVWDIWGSLIYCTTIYTTVGYGHITPATKAGKIVTVLYALLGIPLCLIALAELGKVFTLMTKFLWSFVRRFYYTGQIHQVKQTLSVDHEGKNSDEKTGSTQQIATSSGTNEAQYSNEQIEEEAVEYVVDDEFNLPPIIAILLTLAYIFGGAVMYMQWEDWNYLDAFYFIFISVSTIGFGDVLPAHKKYFLLSFIYQLFGLALVAMVINVVMEVVHSTIRTAKDKVVVISSSAARKVSIPLSRLQELQGKTRKRD